VSAAAIEQERAPAFGRCLLELRDEARRPAAAAVAFDDTLAEAVGRGAAPPIVRIWANDRALVVPRSRLRGQGADSVVDRHGCEWPICGRSSGGAAVAHGPGTLNVSLILRLSGLRPSIDESYRRWIDTLNAALRDAYGIAVDAAPVEGAFCTGSYDASFDGRKLGGVAQARRKGTVLVHGTILTHVDRREYVELIEAAERRVRIPSTHAAYDPNRIVSLHELTGRPVPPDELARAISRTVRTC
jgi:octanoyl-[GcvH]:protein N-octanoyltransferase